jgi:hypothetical protein
MTTQITFLFARIVSIKLFWISFWDLIPDPSVVTENVDWKKTVDLVGYMIATKSF